MTTKAEISVDTDSENAITGFIRSPAIMSHPPPFVEDNPTVWLIQLDLYFKRMNISGERVRHCSIAVSCSSYHGVYRYDS